MNIDISIPCEHWKTADFDAEIVAQTVIPVAYDKADLPDFLKGRPTEISLVLADDQMVRSLNKDYRNQDKATNVLSFAALDSEPAELELLKNENLFPLGDIVLAHETVTNEATHMNMTLHSHYVHLLIHGTLHLVGYDHIDQNEAEEMEALEIEILSQFNIENPYEIHKFMA